MTDAMGFCICLLLAAIVFSLIGISSQLADILVAVSR